MSEAVQTVMGVLGGKDIPRPVTAVFLGSGFSAAVPSWPVQARVPYGDLQGFPECRVQGHAGELLFMELASGPVAVFSGRLHRYEGYEPAEVIFPVDLAAALGVSTLLLSCAAGGIHQDYQAGDLVLVTDHLNLSGWTPPLEPKAFLDQREVYDHHLRAMLKTGAAKADFKLHEGVLACLPGPAYETPAEVRMLERLGADMVCMSTVPEAIRGRALGLKVVALACIANRATGPAQEEPLSHQAVLDRVQQTVRQRAAWFLDTLQALGESSGSGGLTV